MTKNPKMPQRQRRTGWSTKMVVVVTPPWLQHGYCASAMNVVPPRWMLCLCDGGGWCPLGWWMLADGAGSDDGRLRVQWRRLRWQWSALTQMVVDGAGSEGGELRWLRFGWRRLRLRQMVWPWISPTHAHHLGCLWPALNGSGCVGFVVVGWQWRLHDDGGPGAPWMVVAVDGARFVSGWRWLG